MEHANSLGPIQSAYPQRKSESLHLVFFDVKTAERWFNFIKKEFPVSTSLDEHQALSAQYGPQRFPVAADVIAIVWKGYSRTFHFVPHEETITKEDVWKYFKPFGMLVSILEKQARVWGGLVPVYKVTFCSIQDGFVAATQFDDSALKGEIVPLPQPISKKTLEDLPPYIQSLKGGDSRSLTLSHFDISCSRERQSLHKATQKYSIESCSATGPETLKLVFGCAQEKWDFVKGCRDRNPFSGKITMGEDVLDSTLGALLPHKKFAMGLGVNRDIRLKDLPESLRLARTIREATAVIEKDMGQYGMVGDVQVIEDDAHIGFMDIDSAASAMVALGRTKRSSELSEYRDVSIDFAPNHMES